MLGGAEWTPPLKPGWTLQYSTTNRKHYYDSKFTREQYYPDNDHPPPYASDEEIDDSPYNDCRPFESDEEKDDSRNMHNIHVSPPPYSYSQKDIHEGTMDCQDTQFSLDDHGMPFLELDDDPILGSMPLHRPNVNVVEEFHCNQVFSSFAECETVCRKYAKEKGFKVNKSCNYKDGVVFRGRFKCTYKTHKEGMKCPFLLVVQDNGNKKFIIANSLQTNHNHDLENVNITPCGKINIQNEGDLLSGELDIINKFGPYLSMSSLRELLKSQFPHEYNKDLLYRTKKKACRSARGSDLDGMAKLFACGDEIKADGGVFEWTMGEDMRLESLFIRYSGMDEYVKKYGDFVIIDGTFGTNAYGLTLIPLALVDGLGKTIMAGIIICPTEKSEYIIQGMKIIGIGDTGGVLLSDGGSCFPSVARALGMFHRLCAWHFLLDVNKSTLGMNMEVNRAFRNTCSKLVYVDFLSTDAFHQCLGEEKEKYEEINLG